jgi:hypothetical protein
MAAATRFDAIRAVNLLAFPHGKHDDSSVRLGLHCNGDRRINCERLLRDMIFGRHNGVLAPVLLSLLASLRTHCSLGRDAAISCPVSATREGILPRVLVDLSNV